MSSLTSEDDVFIYTEDTLNAFYYTFPLKEIAKRLTPSISTNSIAPGTVQVLYHNPDDMRNIGFAWVPRCRHLWDGRTGVFSHSFTLPQIVTFSLINVITCPSDENIGSFVNYIADTGYVVAPAQRLVMKALPDPGLAESVGGWDLWTIGGCAKSAAWLQHRNLEDTEASTLEVSILDVPPIEDETTWKLPSQAPLGPVDLSSTAGELAAISDYSISSTGEDEATDDIDEDAVSSTEACGGSADQEEAEDNDNDEPPPDFGFGHVCQVSIEGDWVEQCGGIYSLDIDDARGRLAFTTARGEIVVYDLLSASDVHT
jgi:hypothetical protein